MRTSSARTRRSQARRWERVLLAGVVILALVATVAMIRMKPPEQARTITISAAAWDPYIGPELAENGPVAQLLTDVLREIGYTPVFEFSSWSFAEQDVRSGTSVAMAPVIETTRRTSFGGHSEPLLDFRYEMFGKHGSTPANIASRTDLHGIRVARIDGYQFWDAMNDSGASFVDYPSARAAFEALDSGDVDLVIEGEETGRALLSGPEIAVNASGIFEVGLASPLASPTLGLHLFVGARGDSAAFLESFDRALQRYRKTEEYQLIIASIGADEELVEIEPANGKPLAVRDAKGDVVATTPRGTRAVVLAWPSETAAAATVRVKLLDGPAVGRIVSVPVSDVRIVHD